MASFKLEIDPNGKENWDKFQVDMEITLYESKEKKFELITIEIDTKNKNIDNVEENKKDCLLEMFIRSYFGNQPDMKKEFDIQKIDGDNCSYYLQTIRFPIFVQHNETGEKIFFEQIKN